MSKYPFKESNYYNEVEYKRVNEKGNGSKIMLRAYYRREKIGDQYGNQYDNQYEDQYEQYPGSHGDQYIDTPYYGKIKNPYANDPDNDYIYYDDKDNTYTFYEVKTLRELHPAYIHGYIDINGNTIARSSSNDNKPKEKKYLTSGDVAAITAGCILGIIVIVFIIRLIYPSINRLIMRSKNKNKQKKNTKENTNKNTNQNNIDDALVDAYNKAVIETPYDPHNKVPTESYEPDNTSTITYEPTREDIDKYTENIAETNNTIEAVT